MGSVSVRTQKQPYKLLYTYFLIINKSSSVRALQIIFKKEHTVIVFWTQHLDKIDVHVLLPCLMRQLLVRARCCPLSLPVPAL